MAPPDLRKLAFRLAQFEVVMSADADSGGADDDGGSSVRGVRFGPPHIRRAPAYVPLDVSRLVYDEVREQLGGVDASAYRAAAYVSEGRRSVAGSCWSPG